MKLIIQIPCLNEERTLPITLEDLPKQIEGIDSIEILIIDDGSTDKTVEVAKNLGVHHVLQFTNNKGLAKAFISGINQSLKLRRGYHSQYRCRQSIFWRRHSQVDSTYSQKRC